MITLTATIEKQDGSLININYRNSVSLERSIIERSNIQLPSWGIISNGGNLTFIDTDGSIKEMIKTRQLTSGMKSNIYLSNTLSPNSYIENVGEFYTKKWNYDSDNKRVSVQLQDDLEEWQDILFQNVEYNPLKDDTDISLFEIYGYLYDYTPRKYNMLEPSDLDEQTQTHLKNIIVKYFILTANNLWSAWSKFAQASHTHIYKNNGGTTICRYNGGN